MADNWEGIINTTISKYLPGAEDLTMRKNVVYAMARKRGRVMNGMTGKDVDWGIRIKQQPIEEWTDMQTMDFARFNRYKRAVIEPRGLKKTEAYSEQDRLKNSGEEAIIKDVANKLKDLMTDIREQFNYQIYNDGGTNNQWEGVKTFLGTNGTSTKRPVGIPDDTYATNATDLGTFGGEWSNTGTTNASPYDWPHGDGDVNFDCWSPLIVDYTSTLATNTTTGVVGWEAATKTWKHTCLEALRFGILAQQRNGTDGKIDFINMEQNMYREFLEACSAKEGITVTRTTGGEMYELGFQSVNYDGVEIMWDFGCPPGEAFGWPIDQLEILSWFPSLFEMKPIFYDIKQAAHLLQLLIFGNFKFGSPKFWVQWKNLT